MHKFLKLIFGRKLYIFRTVTLSIVRSFFTVHTAMVYVIRVCRQLAGRIRIERTSILILPASCLQTRMTYTIAVCTVKKLLMMDRETVRNIQSFLPKISLRNLCIQVVLLQDICHDAQSHERQKAQRMILCMQ